MRSQVINVEVGDGRTAKTKTINFAATFSFIRCENPATQLPVGFPWFASSVED